MTNHPEDDDTNSDAALRDQLASSGFKPDADGIKWGPARPKILVQGAYKAIRTAAEKARDTLGKAR